MGLIRPKKGLKGKKSITNIRQLDNFGVNFYSFSKFFLIFFI